MDHPQKEPGDAWQPPHVGQVTAMFRHYWENHHRYQMQPSARAKVWNWQRREEAAGTYFTGD